jgi:S-formylglutathione hydrolase FrmB
MSLRKVEGLPGPPWDRPLAGMLDRITVHSQLLEENPLGDPARRPLYVYRSPGTIAPGRGRFPSVYMLQGYSGQADMWLGRSAFDPTNIERIDAMFAAGECPDAVIVFVDAWTSLGGSQFLNSSSTGPYMDYLCDEIVPFVDERYPTLPGPEHRGVAGKSSGGYGAMVVSMLRPDVFGALASHAGDALFEASYMSSIPSVVRTLRDEFEGSYDVFFERFTEADAKPFEKFGDPIMWYGCAACDSPDPDNPGKALLPFDVETARLIDDVWQQWLDLDPVRMAPRSADALRSMRRIYLDAGKGDEYFLDLGATAFARELDAIGAEYTLDLFEGKHGGLTHRYPGAIRELVLGLSA